MLPFALLFGTQNEVGGAVFVELDGDAFNVNDVAVLD